MTFYVENETGESFSEGTEAFPVEETVEKVACAVLDMEGCPYEVQLNVLLTDNDGIHAYNKEYRNIDRETDVLSFPNLDFDRPGDFEISEDSREREYAFLIAHSMLHLCGYDHMEEDEAKVMEAKQEQVLSSLGITRD